MKSYIIGFLKDGFCFYISHVVPPGVSKPHTAFRGSDLATRFRTREEAITALKGYLGERRVNVYFVYDVTYSRGDTL